LCKRRIGGTGIMVYRNTPSMKVSVLATARVVTPKARVSQLRAHEREVSKKIYVIIALNPSSPRIKYHLLPYGSRRHS